VRLQKKKPDRSLSTERRERVRKKLPLVTAPLLPLRDQVLFPGVTIPLYFSRPGARLALEAALKTDRKILVTLQKDSIEDQPGPEGLYQVGTMAHIIQAADGEAQGFRVVLQGQFTARWENVADKGGWFQATMERLKPFRGHKKLEPGRLIRLRKLFSEYVRLETRHSRGLADEANAIRKPGDLLEFIGIHLLVSPRRRQEILEGQNSAQRLQLLESLILMEIQRLSPSEREKELFSMLDPASGPADGRKAGAEDIIRLIEGGELPEAVKARAREEAQRLSHMPPLSPEGVVVRSYIDWLLAMPWKKKTRDRTDLKRARALLDEDHEGLEPVKERILEALAVIHETRRLPPTIIAFIGPPGVGKTSLGQSIAKVLGRKFARISLGGVRDEAEIRGHRRTYVGSMPGRILQAVRRAGTINPVLMLDEVDKLGQDSRGNPAAALLEVLDPEQNKIFSDHYLEVQYDLSKVMFIGTANTLSTVPPPLLDRMEVIELPGYTRDEKRRIAFGFLIPKHNHI
jgi:ATP-dependent Lon protease